MSQILLIAFFIAAHFIPVNVQEFTINMDERNTTFIRNSSDSWKIKKDKNNQIGSFIIKGTSVTVGPKGNQHSIDMANKLSVSTTTNWETLSKINFGSESFQVKRTKSKVVLIPSGKDSKKTITISWNEK